MSISISIYICIYTCLLKVLFCFNREPCKKRKKGLNPLLVRERVVCVVLHCVTVCTYVTDNLWDLIRNWEKGESRNRKDFAIASPILHCCSLLDAIKVFPLSSRSFSCTALHSLLKNSNIQGQILQSLIIPEGEEVLKFCPWFTMTILSVFVSKSVLLFSVFCCSTISGVFSWWSVFFFDTSKLKEWLSLMHFS